MRIQPLIIVLSTGILGLLSIAAAASDWPQWRGPNRDGVWPENGIVKEFEEDQLPLKWSVPIGPGYNGPTVAEGRVYVMDRQTQPTEIERVHCLDWETGKSIWSTSYEAVYKVDYDLGPRASVTIDEGRAYALGTMGNFHSYDAASGETLFAKDLQTEYEIDMPIWGIAASPLIYKDSVILMIGGADGACLISLDKKTGEERWRALDEKPSYSSPILIEQAGEPVLVAWTGESLSGLNPDNGEVHWSHPFKPSRMVLNVATPVFDANRVFVSAFYDGSLLLKLSPDTLTAEKVWRRKGINERNTDSLHCIISTPILEGDYIYGVDSYGELRCLEAATGDRIWEDLTAVSNVRWGNIHFVRNGDRWFMFNEHGELIIGKLSPDGFTEIDRTSVLNATSDPRYREGKVAWSHPAYAYKHIFARNDDRIVCGSLAKE
ncbi:MAG: PQQ-like beta-propeller repeat protein [Candidatus Omnitrophica bacterium]|nr:PQQ-like beta-propeller repeat protein [Candidatus Omnitrophota bacterium]